MRGLLRLNNLALLEEINHLGPALEEITLPPELAPFREWMTAACDALRRRARQNLHDLELNRDDILSDVLSETQALASHFRLCNQRLASSILRCRPTDLLCLRVIAWLHSCHDETRRVPAGLSDGEFGTLPEPSIPVVYFMPPSRQRGLLYLPLFFHEFGHLLYACHKAEMDALVRDLQQSIADALEPVSQHDDRLARQDAEARKAIVETWYEWGQELFCDAAGLTIGGPCFANAFSTYLQMGGRGNFGKPYEELAHSGHPVVWLRIRLIVERARRMGLAEADRLESEWSQIAATMGVVEDYNGFYHDSFSPAIQETIDDMLTEASPYRFGDSDVATPTTTNPSSPVGLLNEAWRVFVQDSPSYADWERDAVAAFLQRAGG